MSFGFEIVIGIDGHENTCHDHALYAQAQYIFTSCPSFSLVSFCCLLHLEATRLGGAMYQWFSREPTDNGGGGCHHGNGSICGRGRDGLCTGPVAPAGLDLSTERGADTEEWFVGILRLPPSTPGTSIHTQAVSLTWPYAACGRVMALTVLSLMQCVCTIGYHHHHTRVGAMKWYADDV